MTKYDEMEKRRMRILDFIRVNKVVKQAEIVRKFSKEFSGYSNSITYRMAITEMLKELERRELIERSVDEKSTRTIPENIWRYK